MVISTVNQVVYNGDGITTAWTYTFPIIEATDIKLTIIDTDGTETDVASDYYVDTVNSTVYYPGYAPGAEPPLEDQPPVLASGQRLVVYRQIPITQEADLGEKWPFNVIELGLDKLTMILQQIYGWWGRCLKLSEGQMVDNPTFDPTLPIEAGKTFRVNDDGTGFISSASSEAAMAAATNAVNTADAAALVASGAVGTANAAKNTADGIAGTANAALTAAGNAVNTANTANSTATNAKNTADGIAGTAQEALDLATENKADLESKATWFATVADMKATNKLKNGYVAATKNYYANGGGGALYAVRNETPADVDDGGSIISLTGNLVAVLIPDNVINVKQFGAKGDGVHDDSVAINNALKYGVGSTVYFPAGVYLCASYSIHPYSSTKVVGEKGKTILRRGYNLSTDNTGVLLYPVPVGSETTIHDLTLQDIILDGNGTVFDQRSFDLTVFSDYPTYNLTIDGCDFLDIIDYHAIDLQQCNRTIIRNCRFMGWEHIHTTDAVALQREAIQFDTVSPDADATRNSHIIIENCYFGASDNSGAYPCAIGNHGFSDSGDTVFFNNVVVRNCTFDNLLYCALHLYVFNDVVIEGNHCVGSCFVNIKNADNPPNIGYANKNIVIQNNNVVGNSDSYIDYAIYNNSYRTSYTESNYLNAAVTNMVIRNNFLSYFAKGIYVEGNGCNGVIVEGNALEHCGDTNTYGSAVDLRAAIKSVKILHNIIKNSGTIWAGNDITAAFTDMLALMSDFTVIGNSFIDPFKSTRCLHIDADMRGVLIKNNVIVDSATNRDTTYGYIKINGNLTGSFIKDNYIYASSAMTVFYTLTGSGILCANNYNYVNNVLSGVEGDEYMPLAGGTLTGDLSASKDYFAIKSTTNTKRTSLLGGNGDNNGGGAFFYGKDWDGTYAGAFNVQAHNGTNSKALVGKPDGTLTWDGTAISLSGHTHSYLPLAGGTMTGDINMNSNGINMGASSSNNGRIYYGSNMLTILGGSAKSNSSYLNLGNPNSAADDQGFYIMAKNSSNSSALLGLPSGSLTWKGQPIQTSSDKRLKQDFADVPADILKAWGTVKWQQFKYKADAETKENARYHVGLVAQDVEESCKNILDYGILCYDKADDLWTVRYEEALCMEAEYQRRKVSALEKRIKTLENKLKKLTQNE